MYNNNEILDIEKAISEEDIKYVEIFRRVFE
ncbi:hypothetical protein BCD95_001129 [Clostridium beijerinckii]|uniref:Uncharacterized protein n=1 Tax=Clostridium beijerinckii TaxID=1520 RepID=A0AAE5LNR3_CLOBE|nr:hypothetical protein [Clostridium beijerinckii]OOM20085.1 hypothetical protein CLOBE_50720 [Clostridium beijerinckii]